MLSLLQALAQPADLNLPVPQALLPPSHLHLTPLDFLLTVTKSLLLAVRILALIALLDHVPNGLSMAFTSGSEPVMLEGPDMLDDARADGQGTQMSGLGSKEGCQRLQHERFVLCITGLT